MDAELVVHRPTPMADVVGRGVSRERFALVLMGAFALVSLALATLGVYGVLSYGVTQRTAEIGIRMALGATAAEVRALVMRQAAIVVGIGVVAGLGGALALGRWLGALAFGVTPSDPAFLAATVLLLAVVAAAASWLPARRATRIEPRIAMQDGRLTDQTPAETSPHDPRRARHGDDAAGRDRRDRVVDRVVERRGVRRRHPVARKAVP